MAQEVIYKFEKMDVPILRKSVRRLTDQDPKGQRVKDLTAALVGHFLDLKGDLFNCDVCGGPSDQPTGVCPYCGAKAEDDEPVMPKTEVMNTDTAKAYGLVPNESPELVEFRQEIAQIKRRNSLGMKALWENGTALIAIRESKRYFLTHKTFEEFVVAECEISVRYANMLMEFVRSFPKEVVEENRPSKLLEMLRVKKNLVKRDKGEKPKPNKAQKKKELEVAITNSDNTTIIWKSGRKSIPLYFSQKKDPPEATGKDLDKKPWGLLVTENRVNIYFTLVEDKKGKLRIYVEEEREG